jgi:2-phospho-L-lactate guanylyltransferase
VGSSAALVVPLKSFGNAKGRLASILAPDQRERLSRECAERVVNAAGDVHVVIVSDRGTDVTDWAARRGLTCIAQTSPGLNGAARDGVDWARASGFDTAVIAHSDIPLADDVAQFIDEHSVVIVPDVANDGTNVLVLPTTTDFTFHYGPGSFKKHVDEAMRRGFAPRIALSDEWSRDLDNPDDLTDPRIKELFPWL